MRAALFVGLRLRCGRARGARWPTTAPWNTKRRTGQRTRPHAWPLKSTELGFWPLQAQGISTNPAAPYPSFAHGPPFHHEHQHTEPVFFSYRCLLLAERSSRVGRSVRPVWGTCGVHAGYMRGTRGVRYGVPCRLLLRLSCGVLRGFELRKEPRA